MIVAITEGGVVALVTSLIAGLSSAYGVFLLHRREIRKHRDTAAAAQQDREAAQGTSRESLLSEGQREVYDLLMTHIDSLDEKLASYDRRIAALQDRQGELTVKLAEARAQIAELRAENNVLRQKLEATASERDDARQRAAAADYRVEQLSQRLEALEVTSAAEHAIH